MRISDWSSDVCSSDLPRLRSRCGGAAAATRQPQPVPAHGRAAEAVAAAAQLSRQAADPARAAAIAADWRANRRAATGDAGSIRSGPWARSEEHTSELKSLMRISYAVFCLKKKR